MEVLLYIKSLLGLVVILSILLFFFFYSFDTKKNRKKIVEKKLEPKKVKQEVLVKKISNFELPYLQSIIKNKNSDAQTLKEALEAIIQYHGKIHPKLGLRLHPDFDIYKDIIFTLCRHPNTNKDLIIYFDKNLSTLNPEYKSSINDTLTMGLDSRGI